MDKYLVFPFLALFILGIYLLYLKKTNKTELNEYFFESKCLNKIDMCHNFKDCCVNQKNKPSNCLNQNMVSCQKFALKCHGKCRTKKMDDDNNNQPNLEKCLESCYKVKKDCCKRIF